MNKEPQEPSEFCHGFTCGICQIIPHLSGLGLSIPDWNNTVYKGKIHIPVTVGVIILDLKPFNTGICHFFRGKTDGLASLAKRRIVLSVGNISGYSQTSLLEQDGVDLNTTQEIQRIMSLFGRRHMPLPARLPFSRVCI